MEELRLKDVVIEVRPGPLRYYILKFHIARAVLSKLYKEGFTVIVKKAQFERY